MRLIFNRLILKTLTLAFVVSVLGCAAFEEKAGPKPVSLPTERVFYGTFDDIWRSVQLALQSPTSYPLRINNMDTGVIETEVVKGSAVWLSPTEDAPPGSGYSYRMIVRVIKGNLSGRQAYKVLVQKAATMQRDFFSEPEVQASDGLEEKVILYRIEREMQVDRAIKRLNKKQNQNS